MIPSLKLGTYELRRFKGTLPRIAIAFLAIVPLMYGLLYLWSNWDPYGKMDRVPAAVVNLDQPAQALGKTVTAGDQLVSELQSDPVLDWHFTDAEDAAAGLADVRMLLQVHDELVFELAPDQVEQASAVIRSVMAGAAEPAVTLSVPLGVEIGTGQSWGAAH